MSEPTDDDPRPRFPVLRNLADVTAEELDDWPTMDEDELLEEWTRANPPERPGGTLEPPQEPDRYGGRVGTRTNPEGGGGG